MFIINQSETYKWPVKISSPIDGGKYQEQELKLHFYRLTVDEINKLDISDIKDEDFFKKIISGWEDVQDDGIDLLFSYEALKRLMDAFPSSRTEIIKGFTDSVPGILQKN
jgi:hypothetical protein